MEYTFHSTNPKNYGEVYCPVIYTGASKQVMWYVSDITTLHYIFILEPTDYIKLNYDGKEYTIYMNNSFLEVDNTFCDELTEIFKAKEILITVSRNNWGAFTFTSESPFSFLDMTYNLKQVLGFYYSWNILTAEFLPSATTVEQQYYLEAESIGFYNYQPVWFLISNLGSPNQITKADNPWTPYFPSVVMKIQNSFQPGQPLTYSNASYVSQTPASALSNLRVKLVDGNLQPLHLLCPLYVSINVQEIPDEQQQPIEEAMAFQESNPELPKAMKELMKKYGNIKESNRQYVEMGLPIEPNNLINLETIETNPQEIQFINQQMNAENITLLASKE